MLQFTLIVKKKKKKKKKFQSDIHHHHPRRHRYRSLQIHEQTKVYNVKIAVLDIQHCVFQGD